MYLDLYLQQHGLYIVSQYMSLSLLSERGPRWQSGNTLASHL